jgi:pSer/pThr/pTyr-binding forkhead associated (FHA) protein
MARLVIVSDGFNGRTLELNAERTTVGRVEDNTYQVAEASVSSHHCEILLQGSEIRVRDLNSTNGTFIEGQQINEGLLKPGQVLRLGKVDMRLEGDAASTPASKKPIEHTMVVNKGVSLDQLDQSNRPTSAASGFTRKDNKGNRFFMIIAGVVLVIILGVLIVLYNKVGGTTP